MSFIRKFAALFFFLFISKNIFAQSGFLSTEKLRVIDSLISASYPDSLPGISVLISKDGEPVYRKATGMADMELKVKLTPENVFGIGSQTKQFTAIGILKLVEQGKVSLTEDIKKYLPDYNTHGKIITIENLLTHTSGIASYTEIKGFNDFYQKEESPEEMISLFQDSSLLFDPSTKWSYTNSGFLVLAEIIEKVSGETYHDFISENLFKPAGMHHTYWGNNESIIPNRAQKYEALDSAHVQNATYYSWSWAWGAGDIVSCTGDMLKWMNALTSGKIVSLSLLQKAWSPYYLSDGRSANYGYGWAINNLNGHRIVTHGGAIGGYLSDAIRIDDMNVYISALSNTTSKSPRDLTGKIALLILNLPFKNPTAINVDPKKQNAYIGVYEANMNGSRVTSNFGGEKEYYYVTTDSGKLFIQRSGEEMNELHCFDADKFYLNNSGRKITFERNKKKSVIAINLFSYPIQYGPMESGAKTDIPLPAKKEAVKVPLEMLKSYTGTYELQPGFNIMINLDSNKIFMQATGQSSSELFAETETHFFLKGIDVQVDFNKDENRKISSLTLTQGQKYICKRISDKTVLSEKKEVKVDQKILSSYCGTYQLQPGFDLTVFLKDNHFFLQATGQGANELFAESDTKFFLKVVDAQVEFVKDDQGNVSKMYLYQGGKKECKRIK